MTNPEQWAEKDDQGRAMQKAPDADRVWQVMENALTQATQEQRRARRWGILFKSITLLYVIGLSIMVWRQSLSVGEGMVLGPHTAVVSIEGVIAASEFANAHDIGLNLKRAFEAPGTQGVLLEINSPGGSPVQSEYVYQTILDLKDRHPNIPVHAVIGDIGASGAYYIAAAADSIHASPASIVGSIGVVAGGFGFTGLMEKLGIERRVITAGENKAMLDPFQPESVEQRAHLQGLLDETHALFIARVREGRGDRLSLAGEDVFDGRVWTGEGALALGLIDSLADPTEVARDWIGAEERVYYRQAEPLLDRLSREFGLGVGQVVGTWMHQGILNPASLSH